MSRAIGRAFKISDKQARSYSPVSAGRMRANPMGVTTLAQVNGRRARSSAASKGAGMKKNAKRGRAKFMRANGSSIDRAKVRRARASIAGGTAKRHVPSAKKRASTAASRRGRRLAAYKTALSSGKSKESARRSALKKVPFTATERSQGSTFAGSKASRSKYRRNRSSSVGGGGKAYASGWEGTFGKKEAAPKRTRKGKKVARKTRRTKTTARRKTAKRKTARKTARRRAPAQFRTVKTTVRRKRRVAYGQYKRAKVYNPRTGRMQYSYMYRTKSGSLRRIPTKAVIGGGKGLKGFDPKRADRVKRGRQRAADKILREGGVFVANKRKRKTTKKKSRSAAGKRLARYNKLLAQGYSKAEAHAIAFGGKKMAKRRKKTTKRRANRKKTTRRRVKARRKSTRKTGRRKSAKRVAAGKKAARTRKRRAAAKRGGTKKTRRTRRTRTASGRRKSAKRVAAGKKAARTRKRRASARRGGAKRSYRRNGRKRSYAANRRRSYSANRRRSRRSYTMNGRRFKKNAFMANLAMVAKAGALIAVGFVTHRVLTSLACEYIFAKIAYPEGQEASPTSLTLKKWEKPICGTVVAIAGVGATTAAWESKLLKSETALALGGGMIASLVQSLFVSALMAFDQPKVAAHLEGYSNSMAYQLRGARGGRRGRRRAVHGMQSIMPRYAPVGMFEQAAAGYEQAAAGTGRLGEYFTANAAAVGEYFVPRGTQGVGQYEPAGPLALQAAAGTHMGQIYDGIRPDGNLDRELDLAESAAGLGEYITATPDNGGFAESRVPTQSQWIPNGPLWAGELKVKDNMQVSETAAGVLTGPGGNGILSG